MRGKTGLGQRLILEVLVLKTSLSDHFQIAGVLGSMKTIEVFWYLCFRSIFILQSISFNKHAVILVR